MVLLALALTLYFALGLEDLRALPEILASASKVYVLMGLLTMVAFFLCQALVVKKLLCSLGYQVSLKATYKYSLIDYFFSQISPGASAGQPSEIYFMKKDGIAIGDSSLVMLIFNGFYHLAVVLVVLGTSLGKIDKILGPSPVFYRLFVFGILVQVLLSVVFFFFIFSKSLVYKVFKFIFKVLEFFSYKNLDHFKARVSKILRDYKTGAAWIKDHKLALAKVFPLVILHIFLYYSLGYWVLKALGSQSLSLVDMVAYQGVFTMTFESLPLPGGLGLAEAGFLKIFSPLYGKNLLPAALLLTRGLSYLVFVILGGLLTALGKLDPVQKIDQKNKDKKD
ncbi:MAG: lysylphosphatidylglycerol synthase transmembrane domain-containing protein [Bacillota bacterium]|nr:lysylphosphatidylglycerol synthase transmembrane domain-containing protein [Bacillota bacterium]